jgi:hypothetical protein
VIFWFHFGGLKILGYGGRNAVPVGVCLFYYLKGKYSVLSERVYHRRDMVVDL